MEKGRGKKVAVKGKGKKKKKEEVPPGNVPAEDDRSQSHDLKHSDMMLRKHVGNYTLGKQLGRGAYGVVYKAIHTEKGNTVAVKQLYLQSVSPEIAKTLQMEIHLLRGLQHSNIVQYIDHIMVDSTLNIVMEYVENGSLYGMLRDYGCFPEELCKVYIKKTLQGLVYLHEQGVIHRDIKGANILITKEGDVKLADFGVSQNMSVSGGDDDALTPMGTPFYMAPEVIQFMGAQPQSDVWSLGCTIIELLKGDPPYFDLTPFSAIYKIVNEGINVPSGISASLADFLSKCFQRDPALRVSAKELTSHPWLRKKEAEAETTVEDAAKKIAGHKQKLNMVKTELESAVRKSDSYQPTEGAFDVTKLLDAKDEKEREGQERLKEKEKGKRKAPAPEEDDPFADVPDADSVWPSDPQPPKEQSYDDIFADVDQGADLTSANSFFVMDGEMDLNLDDDIDLADRLEGLQMEMADDPFEIDTFDTFEEESEETLLMQQKRDAIRIEIEDLLETLNHVQLTSDDVQNDDVPQMDHLLIERTCLGLVEFFRIHRDHISIIMTRNSLLTLVQLLLLADGEGAILSLLKLIVHVIQDDVCGEEIKVNFCVMGGIPNLIRIANSQQSKGENRIAAAFIIQEICTLPQTLQMFVACDGLGVLVQFLHSSNPIDMNRMGINAILLFLKKANEIRIHKHQFFQVLLDHELMDTLAGTLQRLLTDRNEAYILKALDIVTEFAQGVSAVKQDVCKSSILGVILNIFNELKGVSAVATSILKIIRNLAVFQTSIVFALRIFMKSFIEFSMECIEKGQSVQDVHNNVLHILFHLCVLNPENQSEAAQYGVIQFLRHIVSFNNSLKEFAIPMLCDFARCRPETRHILLESGGLELYLGFLSDKSWYIDCFQAIADWCSSKSSSSDMACVESVLQKQQNVAKLIEVYKVASRSKMGFVNVLDSFLKITNASVAISRALSEEQSPFIGLIGSSLQSAQLYAQEKLLRVLINLFEKHASPWEFISQPQLWDPLNTLAASSVVVIRNLAILLIENAERKRDAMERRG